MAMNFRIQKAVDRSFKAPDIAAAEGDWHEDVAGDETMKARRGEAGFFDK